MVFANRNVCIVSSAIVVSSSPLSYTKVRSGFTSSERFNQTKETIESIREYIPDVFVIIADATNIPDNWKAELLSIVDHCMFLDSDDRIHNLAMHSPHKAIPECETILQSLYYIREHGPNVVNIFKISGRYKLTRSFEYAFFNSNNEVMFKQIPQDCFFYEKCECYYTFFFKIPARLLDECVNAYVKSIELCETGKSLETVLPFQFKAFQNSQRTVCVRSLGVEGLVGPSRRHFKEFDWEVYLASNRDILQARLLLPTQLQTHYSRHSKTEKRVSSSNKPRVLCISHCYTAGTYYYYEYLSDALPQCLILYYSKKTQLIQSDLTKVSAIHVFSVHSLDIDMSYLLTFLSKAKALEIPIYMTFHDYQWLFRDNPNPSIRELEAKVMLDKGREAQLYNVLQNVKQIFAPSQYVYDEYTRLASEPLKSLLQNIMIVAANPDIAYEYDNLVIPDIQSQTINIAYIGAFTPHKGSSHFATLAKSVSHHEGCTIKYHVFGSKDAKTAGINNVNMVFHGKFADAEIINLLHKHNIHIVTFIGEIGETYGFCMSKAIASGIPIVYRNIGSFKTRMHVLPKFFAFEQRDQIDVRTKEAINYVIQNKNTFKYTAPSGKHVLADGYSMYSMDCLNCQKLKH